MEYRVDKCGLLIGLVDNQSEISSEKLFEEEFKKNIFSGYRDHIEEIGGEIDKELYKPVGYHLFGDCNMAVLSLIDDFAFPNRVLHTGHGYISESSEERKYTLQIVNGIHTWIEDSTEIPTLQEQALSTFLRTENAYPFIGIVSYKLNNGLLIGNGTGLLEILKRKLFGLKKSVGYSIELICIDCFSNDELTVVYFSTELSSISYFTNETRILKLRDLAEESDNDICELVDNIAGSSLLYESLKKKLSVKERLDIVKDAHIFSTSFSHLGYAMTLDDCLPVSDEKLIFQYHWDLKPGHYNDFKKEVVGEKLIFDTSAEERIMPGIDMMQLIVKDETFSDFRNKTKKLVSNKKIAQYIRKQRINVIFSKPGVAECINKPNHPELMKRLSECRFSHQELIELRKDLDACRVSKVLKERTLKMYGTFNDCITDLLFFNYFIELKGYLEGIRIRIHKYLDTVSENTSLEDFHVWLNRMIRNFEQAYYNRFHHSSRMRNISDFNLEYNGGIQQLISAYDTAYKAILKEWLGEESNYNCVYVSGYEKVSSDRDSLRINISHITYPELYAATVWKEALNFYWSASEYANPQSLNQVNVAQNKQLLSISDNIRMLKNKILYNKAYVPSSYVHTLMLNSTNELFIHYLMADVVVFKTGYMSDFNVFSFWYWHYFSQMSHFYTHEGDMQPEVFVKFLARWVFTRHFKMGKRENIQEDYVAFDPKLSELWHCYVYEVSTFIEILLEELERFDFLSHINAEAILMDYKHWGMEDFFGRELHSDEEQKMLEMFRRWNAELRKQEMAFQEGKVILLDRQETTDFSFIRNLMYNYLQSISGLNESEERKTIHVLERNKKGEILKRHQYCSILSDPLGGMFLVDNSKREDYFKLRSVFYKSLWGAGLQMKKDCLLPYFKNNM